MATHTQNWLTYRNIVSQAFPIAKVRQTTNQTLTTGIDTVITMTTVEFDNYSAYNTGTSTYTVPMAGWYQISVAVAFSTNTTGRRASEVYKNGSSLQQFYCVTTASTGVTVALSTNIALLAFGDLIVPRGAQDSGGNLTTQVGSGYNSWMAVEWLRGA